MKLSISEILKEANSKKNKQERIAALHKHDSFALRHILRGAFDPAIKWLLPEGDCPYTPSKFFDQQNMLFTEARRLYLFIEGGNPNLSQVRRETIFIQMLEALDPEDALLMVSVKDKKLPYKNITPALVLEAYPGLW